MARTIGTNLTADDQRHVLAGYVHRFTGDHKPAWTHGADYKVQFKDDADWLAHTTFETRLDGRLDDRWRVCESRPTWPKNPELRKA
jgi:hypothetical protein